MCEEIHEAGRHTAKRLARRLARRLAQDRTFTDLGSGPMIGIPRDIFSYKTKSPPNPFRHYSTRSTNAPRYATPTQILPTSPPPTMTQMEETPPDTPSWVSTFLNPDHSQSDSDESRPLSPIYEDFEEQLPNRSNHFYGNNLSRPFRHSDLEPKQDKDVVIGEPSSNGQKRPQYFQLYRFENSGQDWTAADRIRVSIPQDKLKKKVDRGKSRITVVDTLANMPPIHRGQINRLLDEKNNDERDRDTKWVPVLIEKKGRSGKSILIMDVIIAKTFIPGGLLTRDNWVVFADEKSDLRASIKPKGKPLNRERLNPDEDLANGQKLFTDDGTLVDVKRQISEKRSLPLRGPISQQVLDFMPLFTPASVTTAAVILPQASLPIRPKLELNSSIPYLPLCKEEDYTIAASELSRISDELTKYFTYYCSVAGCIHSASPELCVLDSRNAKTIHDGETHKVYVLDGLSAADLTAHIFEAHKIAIEDSRHLVDLLAYKHTPLVAEERRFTVPSVTDPDASGWLMRTRLAGHAWSDWKGLDYDIIAASGFRSWDCKNCPCKSQPRSSNACTNTATDESIDCALKSNAPVDVLHRETGGSLERPAELPVNISAGEMRHTVDSVEAIAIHGSFDSTKQLNSHSNAKSHSCPDGQPPAPTSLMSTEVERGSSACTEGSARSISDDGSLSPQETNSDEDIDSDVSITGRTKRRVLENIMNEVQTVLFGNFSGTLRCQSEGSESASSSEVLKPSSSFEQTSKTQSSTSAGKKRAQDHDPFSEDEDDSNQKRHKKSIPASLMTARARLLACPFNKHNSKIYSPCNEGQDLALQFRTCGGPGWPTVHRLKEHLYRVHPTPIQCKRCWLTMKTEKELEEHVRAQEPCLMQPQLVQWVPRDKVEALKDRKKACQSQNEEERWNYVYGLLFPEDLSLPSPYYDDSEDRPQDDRPKSPSSRNLAAFEKFSQENLPRRIREAFEAMLNERVLPIEESLKMALPEVVRSCQAQIFRDWERFSSKVSPKTARDTLHETIEAEETAIPGHYNAQPPPGNESLSTFFVEPAPAAIENAFNIPAHFDDYGEGPPPTIADSGYHSLRQQSDLLHREPSPRPTPMIAAGITNVCSLEDDPEDPGEINLEDPTDFDWNDYLVETGSSPTGKP